MKRLATFLLILTALFSMLLCLNSCKPQPDDPIVDPEPEVPMVDIVKDGVTQYNVVRSEKSGGKDGDTLAAIKLRRLIVEATGSKIDISDDWEKDDESKLYEILVGKTNRPETALLPETLARDVALFKSLGYLPGSVTPFDLFPMTGHVESVVCLTRSDKAT